MKITKLLHENPRIENSLLDFQERFIEKHIESNVGIVTDELEEDTLKHFRTMANTDYVAFVKKKLNDFINECKIKREIWEKTIYPYNRTWIVDDKQIKKTLKRYPKLLDILSFIDGEGKPSEKIDAEDWISYQAETRLGPETRKYSHVIVSKDFYERAEKTIGIKQITMQKYLQAFSRMGILKMIERLKSHERAMLYIDGYFRRIPPNDRLKKEHFMNQKDHQQALRNFKYR